jgi:hypothetical protein
MALNRREQAALPDLETFKLEWRTVQYILLCLSCPVNAAPLALDILHAFIRRTNPITP